MMHFDEIYGKIGYSFNNESWILRALTHSSFDRKENYERLEFLGDSIVGYAVSDLLYREGLPDEGDMTKKRASMVSKEPLAYLSDLFGFSAACRRKNCALSVKMKCDLYEAVTAAIAMDGGFDAAVDFVKRTIPLAPQATPDYKSMLKEKCERERKVYAATHTEAGQDNRKLFTMSVSVGGAVLGVGQGRSLAKAESEACRQALLKLGVLR